jgi:hypothetical protein
MVVPHRQGIACLSLLPKPGDNVERLLRLRAEAPSEFTPIPAPLVGMAARLSRNSADPYARSACVGILSESGWKALSELVLCGLIDALSDAHDMVRQAAGLGLVEQTGEGFGFRLFGSRKEHLDVQARWLAWYARQGRALPAHEK